MAQRKGSKSKSKSIAKATPRKSRKPLKAAHRAVVEERRNQSRVPLQLQVQYRIKQNYTVDLSQDISPGGIFIHTTSPLPKGTTVELTFRTDGHDQHVTAEGRVVWSNASKSKLAKRRGMGIEFTRVDIEGQRMIDDLINDFLRKVSII